MTVDDAPGRRWRRTAPSRSPSRRRPPTAVTVRAIDRAGNVRGVRTEIPIAPRAPIVPTRAVHMTAISWRHGLRCASRCSRCCARARSTRSSSTSRTSRAWSATTPRSRWPTRSARSSPSTRSSDAVKQIHDLGGRVIGRVVAFRDPILARYAWDNGDREQVIQSPGGSAYQGYGGFTNFADPVVRQYNIDVATEAARAGVDDILYDYVRRPDGPLETMVFPGLQGRRPGLDRLLPRRGPRRARPDRGLPRARRCSASPPTGPRRSPRTSPRIARNVDYIAPLIYPSHWGPGVYGVAEPESRAAQDHRGVAEGASTTWSRAAAPAWSRGSRTSRCAVPLRAQGGLRPGGRAPRPRAWTSGSCGTRWSPTRGRPASSGEGGPPRRTSTTGGAGALEERLDLGAHAVVRLAADLRAPACRTAPPGAPRARPRRTTAPAAAACRTPPRRARRARPCRARRRRSATARSRVASRGWACGHDHARTRAPPRRAGRRGGGRASRAASGVAQIGRDQDAGPAHRSGPPPARRGRSAISSMSTPSSSDSKVVEQVAAQTATSRRGPGGPPSPGG